MDMDDLLSSKIVEWMEVERQMTKDKSGMSVMQKATILGSRRDCMLVANKRQYFFLLMSFASQDMLLLVPSMHNPLPGLTYKNPY